MYSMRKELLGTTFSAGKQKTKMKTNSACSMAPVGTRLEYFKKTTQEDP